MDSAMTLQEANSVARHLGLTLRGVRSGDYRVNFRDGNETTAYYTDNLEDAVNAVVESSSPLGSANGINELTTQSIPLSRHCLGDFRPTVDETSFSGRAAPCVLTNAHGSRVISPR